MKIKIKDADESFDKTQDKKLKKQKLVEKKPEKKAESMKAEVKKEVKTTLKPAETVKAEVHPVKSATSAGKAVPRQVGQFDRVKKEVKVAPKLVEEKKEKRKTEIKAGEKALTPNTQNLTPKRKDPSFASTYAKASVDKGVSGGKGEYTAKDIYVLKGFRARQKKTWDVYRFNRH